MDSAPCERARDGLPAALLLIWLLSVVDWALTVDALALGIASEANPVAAAMLGMGDWQSLIVKQTIVGVCCLALLALRSHRLARSGAYICAVAYAVVVVYQCLARLVVL